MYSRVSSLKFVDSYSLVIKHDLLDNRQFRIDANVGDFLAARHVDSGWQVIGAAWMDRCTLEKWSTDGGFATSKG